MRNVIGYGGMCPSTLSYVTHWGALDARLMPYLLCISLSSPKRL